MEISIKKLKLLNVLVSGLILINPFVVPFTLHAEEPLSFPVENSETNIVEDTISNDVEVQEEVVLDQEFNLNLNEDSSLNDKTVLSSESLTGTLYKIENFSTNTLYTYPLNDNVRINFLTITSELENPYFTIEQVDLNINGVDVNGYEFNTNLENESFKYEMTLPNPYGENSKVRYLENVNDQASYTIEEVYPTENLVTFISDHFTVFVVTPTPITGCTGGVYLNGVCFATIQEAINFASNDINKPHTITLDTGLYTEDIVINNDPELEGLTIEGSGINNSIISGKILINGGAYSNNYTFKDFELQFNTGVNIRGMDIKFEVSDLLINNVRFQNYPWYALSFDNTINLNTVHVSSSEFINNYMALKVASTAKVQNFNFHDNLVNGMSLNPSYGIYTAGEETFLPSFGNPVFNNISIMNNSFVNIGRSAIHAEVLSNALIEDNLFENNYYTAINIFEAWTNSALLDEITISKNTFKSGTNTDHFISIGGYEMSLNKSTLTDGIEDIYISQNKFDGATTSAVYFWSSGNSNVFKDTLNEYVGLDNIKFFSNEFSNNIIDINLALLGLDLDALTTLTWSKGNKVSDWDLVEEVIQHDCEYSPFLHGACNLDDYSEEFGSVEYAILDASSNTMVDVLNTHTNNINLNATKSKNCATSFPCHDIKMDFEAIDVPTDDYRLSFAIFRLNNANDTPYPANGWVWVRNWDHTLPTGSGTFTKTLNPTSICNNPAICTVVGGALPEGKYVVYSKILNKNTFEFVTNSESYDYFVIDNTAPSLDAYTFDSLAEDSGIFYGRSINDFKISYTISDPNLPDLPQGKPASGLFRSVYVIWDANSSWGVVGGSHKCNWGESFGGNTYHNSSGVVLSASVSDKSLKDCNPSYTWPNGRYIVTLAVIDNSGNINYVTQSKFVILNEELNVSITTNPADTTTLEAITMNGNVSNGFGTKTYSWGNGNFLGCSGNLTSVITPATSGTYTCELNVTDELGNTGSAVKTVNVLDIEDEEEPPIETTDLFPTILLSGDSPALNSGGTILISPNTNFTVTAFIGLPGNPNYSYIFGGICSGNLINTNIAFHTSTVLNLSGGNYVCSVTLTDNDGDVANASVNVIVGGIGGPQVQGTNTNNSQPNNEEDSSDVAGLIDQKCDNKYEVSGFVFKDLNGNNKKDNNEEGVSEVELTINAFDEDNNEVVVKRVTTNSIGYWETELCNGDYLIRIETDDIPEGYFLGGDDNFKFQVLGEKDNVNFAIYTSTTTGLNWWVIILFLLVLLLIGGGYYVYTRNRPVNV